MDWSGKLFNTQFNESTNDKKCWDILVNKTVEVLLNFGSFKGVIYLIIHGQRQNVPKSYFSVH